MKRYVCIHGHFYQPPRENPWLEEVELQDSAAPYHDWNERITEECYAPNTASRILDTEGRIIDIANLYSKISFNFGPTLLSWMERHRPDVYGAVLEADKVSMERFGGHGSAMAQVYNHMIMPLATGRDKTTQVRWGIGDFRRRFGREPEGMWLPETAVDLETLDVLAGHGIRFTILAPRQAARVRDLDSQKWVDVGGERIDPTRPYLCRLASGREIALFFYDGPISRDVAFGGLLSDGARFAERMLGSLSQRDGRAALGHIATDGESYGHHHRGGDMALAFCLHRIEEDDGAVLTNYGEFLERYPPRQEVEIVENSSWSCVHGVERWRSDCGCHSGAHPVWNQAWRRPLREGMGWLGERLDQLYEEAALSLRDPWAARDEYAEIVGNRDRKNIEQFLKKHCVSDLKDGEISRILKLMEMQKNAQFLFTSCGWFFDDITGIETVQVLRYAGRAIQFAEELGHPSLERGFREFLARARGNRGSSGEEVFDTHVTPVRLDPLRVGAHYCISSLFEDYPEKIRIYSYTCTSEDYEVVEAGKVKLVTGKVRVASDLTLEEELLAFAVLHMGDQNLTCGVRPVAGPGYFAEMRSAMAASLEKGDVTDIVRLIDDHFRPRTYNLWHLFKDEQRKVLDEIMRLTYEGIESSYRRIHETNYPLMNYLTSMGIPLPRPFLVAAEYLANSDIHAVLEDRPFDGERLKKIMEDVRRWSLVIDRETIGFHGGGRITALMEEFSREPGDTAPVETVITIIVLLRKADVKLDLWKAQNIYFTASLEILPSWRIRAAAGEEEAERWVKIFLSLGSHLGVKAG
jgi:alpha-amylase/alpha-mannosidase (GH57 family)